MNAALRISLALLGLCGSLLAAEPLDVTFKAACDGSEQHYVMIFPPDYREADTHDVLIALHGHGSDRWQFARDPRDECRAARDTAAEHHMLFISPDYRARTSWMGPKAEADLLQIIADLRREHHIGKVYLCGASMGGSSTLTFTALHPDLITGAAAMNATANHLEYANFQDAISASFGGSKANIPEEYKKRSAEYWPERFTMPLGLTTSGQDKSVPPESVMRLARVLENMHRPVLLIHRPAVGHSTAYDDARRILEYALTGLSASTHPTNSSQPAR